MPFPSILLGHLRTCVPGFSTEKPRDQLSLAKMLWACAESGREHKVWPDMSRLSMDEIRDLWGGTDERMRKVVGYRYFSVHQGSNQTEATNGYAPSIHMAKALALTINSPEPIELLDEPGKASTAAGNVISSRAAPTKEGGNRQTKWKGAKPTKIVPINTGALADYRAELLAVWTQRRLVKRATDWVRRQIRSIDMALAMARNARWPGHFPMKYREGSTGRLSAQGHSLQSMPGLVRGAALAGAWDYDISTCQWTILAQMATRLGLECPLTDAYIADKGSLRRRVSEGAQISLDDAKKCITALLFGAVVQRSEKAMRFHPGDIVKAILPDAAKRLSVQADFIALHAEIGGVGDSIVRAWPRSNGRLFNDLRIQFDSGSELAHLLQGAEAAALHAVVMQQQSNILLCVHDGWVASERLDVDELGDYIYAKTRYRFGIEESQLTAPSRDQIQRKLDEFEGFSEGELTFECPFAVTLGRAGEQYVLQGAREPWKACDDLRVGPISEAALWTAFPNPEEPLKYRMAFQTPRPKWNQPPGSTADYIERKPGKGKGVDSDLHAPAE